MNRNVVSTLLLIGLAACASDGGPAGPEPSASALRYSRISGGYFHTCGLAISGLAYCWGGNDIGTLGDGTHVTRSAPTAVIGNLAFTDLDAGAGHACAITSTGTAWCWGQNDEGQLADGTFVPRDRPVAVRGNLSFVRISAGHAHSCGVTAAGAGYCWGDNIRGQLGAGIESPSKSATPLRVLSDLRFSHVIADYYQTCGLTTSGEAYCWGGNESGQVGDGSKTNRSEPARVSGGRLFSSISPGDRFVCGISGGATLCWGANRHGELGRNGVATGATIPIALDGAPAFTSVFTAMGASTVGDAEAYGCGISNDGRALCWGGAIGGLRLRTATIDPLDDALRFTTLGPGSQHLCALATSGYAYCGGLNAQGQLGDGTQTNRPRLVPVAGPTK